MPQPPRHSVDARLPLVEAALKGVCPRCGNRTLFAGWVRFDNACRVCGLDYTQFNVGDGPAAFLTLLIGGAITTLAVALELAVSPPIWVHMIWVPLIIGSTLGSLRLAKAMLLTVEYRRRAVEGRIGETGAISPQFSHADGWATQGSYASASNAGGHRDDNSDDRPSSDSPSSDAPLSANSGLASGMSAAPDSGISSDHHVPDAGADRVSDRAT